MAVQFFYLTQCLLLHYLGKEKHAKYALQNAKNEKNILNTIDRNLNHENRILIILAHIFLTQLAIK